MTRELSRRQHDTCMELAAAHGEVEVSQPFRVQGWGRVVCVRATDGSNKAYIVNEEGSVQ